MDTRTTEGFILLDNPVESAYRDIDHYIYTGQDIFFTFPAVELTVSETNSIQYLSNTSSVDSTSESSSIKYTTGQ